MCTNYDGIARTKINTHRLERDLREDIQADFPRVRDFYEQSSIKEHMTCDVFYRIMRGEPRTKAAVAVVRSAWRWFKYTDFDRDKACLLLAKAAALIEEECGTKLTAEAVYSNLVKHHRTASF